jgi:hypothetical protein
MNGSSNRAAAPVYMTLLTLQTFVATLLIWTTVPVFRRMILNVGEPLETGSGIPVATIAGAIALQICYWIRFYKVSVYGLFCNDIVSHLVLFAGRASFFFGGALFSVVFFRHIPELSAFPPLAVASVRVTTLLVVLFSLFCYSLELERFGRAIGQQSAR